MTLADRLANPATAVAPSVNRRRSAPKGFEPGVKFEAGQAAEVTLTVTEIPENETAWREKILEHTEIDVPDHRKVELTAVRYWGDPIKPMVYVRFEISDRPEHVEAADVAETLKIIRANRKPSPRKTVTGRTRVVVVSDAQVGKTASGGGTPELLERVSNKLDQLVEQVKRERCDELVIVDPGDLIENCFNVTSQAHLNDLSVPEQLRVARGLLAEIVGRLSTYHQTTRVVTVPSNHGQARVKQGQGGVAGKASDDYGIDVHRAVAEAFHMAGRDDVAFVIPEPWRESLALQVEDLVIGVVHGHQYRPGKAAEWWQGQSHGDQPTAAANILLTGHYHNFAIEQSGALDGKPRWIIQADAMDGGSDWFQNLTGEVSEPSILTFTVEGSEWGNLHRITARPDEGDTDADR